jgi:site-specific DNA recombinase
LLLTTTPAAPAIYVRWSTDEQGSGTTLEEQRQTCLSFMADRGWPVREDLIFIDDGYSAGSLERPGMAKLRAMVEKGIVDAVIVYKLDRLTRNIVDAVDLVLREWEGRCALVSVTQSAIDTTSPMGRQFFTLMASFAEFEREMIRDRTLSGKKRRAMQGRNPGFRPAYGYKSGETPGVLLLDEGKAPIVRRIFEQYSSGISLNDVARQLNREAVPPPGTARGWTDRTIRYMLQNPIYVGRLEYGKTSVNSPQKKKALGRHKTVHKAPRWAVVQGAFPAIISDEMWATAQTVMKSRGKETGFNGRSKTSYLLTGLMRCRCGGPYAGVTGSGSVDYYRCRNGTAGACNAKIVRADLVDQIVLESLRGQLRDRMGQRIVDAAFARASTARGASEATVGQLRGALAQLERQLEKARGDYMAGTLTGSLYSELAGELKKKEKELRGALAEAEYALAHPVALQPDAEWLLGNIDKVLSDTWETMDMGQKKQALRTLVSSLVVYRDKSSDNVEVELTMASLDAESSEPVITQMEVKRRERRAKAVGE